jgi:hypothetical protein
MKIFYSLDIINLKILIFEHFIVPLKKCVFLCVYVCSCVCVYVCMYTHTYTLPPPLRFLSALIHCICTLIV